jgi:hypothetical protein
MLKPRRKTFMSPPPTENRLAGLRNHEKHFNPVPMKHVFIIETIFIESRAIRLDLQQIYGNGRAMKQKVSRISRCIINAS